MNSGSDTITARATAHSVRTVRHLESGTRIHDREECVLTLSGPATMLSAVRSIGLGTSSIRIDREAGLVRHESHADPLVAFTDAGESHLQIFLHDIAPADAPQEAWIGTDMRRYRLAVGRLETPEPEAFESALEIVRGRPVLEVTTSSDAEIVEQRMILGRYEERRLLVPPGKRSVHLDPGFADVFGVVVSTTGIHGGIEHKHQILGRFGYPSGRTLLRDGVAFASGQTEPHRFRSAIAVADDSGLPGGTSEPWNGMDEVEVWCSPTAVDAVTGIMRDCPIPWSFRTYGPSNSPSEVAALSPWEAPPADGRRFSYCLFAEEGEFLERLEAAIAHADNRNSLDRPWLSTEEAPHTVGGRYGIAWCSTPTDTLATKRSLAREVRHLATGIISEEAASGMSCIPLPHPGGENGFNESIRRIGNAR